MVEPTGYTALDLIGFTDKGSYDPLANYVRNDLVHVGNSTWRCKIDDTTGITPTEGANWTIFIESATSLSGMSDVDLNTPKAGDGLVHDGNDWTNVPIVTEEMQDILGAKNLFPNEATTQTINGITFTVNADKSVTLNGTSTQAIYLILYTINSSEKNICKAGKRYKISGYNPADASLDWGYVYIVGTSAYSSSVALVSEFDGWEYDSTKYVYLFVREGKTLNNIIVKPMITIASQPNSDYAHYVPYAKTNRELTEDTKIETFTLTPDSTNGVTGSAVLIKCGKVCVVNGYFTLSSALTSNKKIFEFPSAANIVLSAANRPFQWLVSQTDGTKHCGVKAEGNTSLNAVIVDSSGQAGTYNLNLTFINV